MMRLSLSIRYVILFSIFFSRVVCSSNSSKTIVNAPRCHPEESSALLRFNATFSDTPVDDILCNTQRIFSWNASQDCCEWEGIRCSADTGHVVALFLDCVRLQGAITSNSSLFSLAHLEILHLSYVDLRGSPILPEFGRFRNLTQLYLFNCNFKGSVPLEIAHLTKLVSFTLSRLQNDVRISIGASEFKALAQNATKLREVALFNVDMSTVSLASFANLSSSLTSMRLEACKLNGELPDTAFHFPKLRLLNLKCNNNLHGNFPWSSINLESLSNLDLSNNNFEGKLPHVYSNFTRKNLTKRLGIPFGLTKLRLSRNSFDGTIPSWIYEPSSLSRVDLSNNQFTGELNEFHTTSLVSFSVGGNWLNGQIPKSLFQNAKLMLLDISSNNFTGNLEIAKLSHLKQLSFLDLSRNDLSLSFNDSMNHTFEKLHHLYLSSCNIREFPKFFKSCKQLGRLDLSDNQMQGSIPKWFEEFGKESLSYLNISHNFLTSTSMDPSHWKILEYFDISSNFFSGSLPIPNSSVLNTFLASNNQFSGPIPTSVCKFKSLELLGLSNNNLSGDIPQCMGNFSKYLSVLDLRNNKLRGTIPANFSTSINRLRSLNLNGNQLEGPLPRSLAYCKSLEVVDLGNNLLNDTFPNWLEALPALRVLVLRANKFHGSIGIPMISIPFPELRIIDLSDNDLAGTLPIKYIENFKAMVNDENVTMKYMGVQYYHDSIVVNMKGNEIEMVRILTIFTTIDLSNNHFMGEIPVFLGQLKSLKNLNLSHNKITGSIPSSLGKLSNLEGLDLSCNELVGKIPNELLDINWLSFLNLSYNHLEGSIPHGKQFDTFNNNSYVGNLGLCGFPMSESCDNNKVQHDQGGKGEIENGISLDWKVVMMGYASGVVIGISIGYMVVFSQRFDYWTMKRFGIRQSRRRLIHRKRGGPRRN